MTREEIENAEVGLRFNEGKLQWSQMHYASMAPLIRVLEYGAKKYTKGNWQKGMCPIAILECLQRHLAAIIDGETKDPESGLPHIGHVMANAMMYSYYTEVFPDKALPEK